MKLSFFISLQTLHTVLLSTLTKVSEIAPLCSGIIVILSNK